MDIRKSILIVEDDDNLRRIMKNILGSMDYEVLTAGRGEEALELCQRHEGEIDLLIADMVMPGISGSELVKSVIEIFPDVRVIKMSGMMDLSDSPGLGVKRQFLKKPFDADTLRERVRLALDRKI